MIEPERRRKERQIEILKKMRERAEAEGDTKRVKNIDAGIASNEQRLSELATEPTESGGSYDTARRG